ncbi:hypothetical protein LX36DRAFT_317059 [Colletotrichum falcatum]|nr:hypothetical protein LX36DRAFT_317059 [Colletotrichum falcatum]
MGDNGLSLSLSHTHTHQNQLNPSPIHTTRYTITAAYPNALELGDKVYFTDSCKPPLRLCVGSSANCEGPQIGWAGVEGWGLGGRGPRRPSPAPTVALNLEVDSVPQLLHSLRHPSSCVRREEGLPSTYSYIRLIRSRLQPALPHVTAPVWASVHPRMAQFYPAVPCPAMPCHAGNRAALRCVALGKGKKNPAVQPNGRLQPRLPATDAMSCVSCGWLCQYSRYGRVRPSMTNSHHRGLLAYLGPRFSSRPSLAIISRCDFCCPDKTRLPGRRLSENSLEVVPSPPPFCELGTTMGLLLY